MKIKSVVILLFVVNFIGLNMIAVDILAQERRERVKIRIIYPAQEEVRDGGVLDDPMDILVLVNKDWSLPEYFEADDLVVPNIPYLSRVARENRLLREEAALALEKLFAQAKEDGIKLYGVSAYRSYARQKFLFDYYTKKLGEEEAKRLSAKPGHSEHQSGLAIDLTSSSVGYGLTENFGETKEGKWLAQVGPEFGFIIRYPQGREDTTGYSYEPWHIRYVGEEAALEIHKRGIVLEEYLGK
ncbi:M15 family metallopeptidase [Halonatronum saccharophilum]|uniref:M15 family metallopeptidase n=1 Tax=Halonatronum saccharophilum TaxID=150060 RepID=UPI0004B7DF98|nr:M15 family metallopeptidase [Halonatronum saccharophilum]